MVSGKEQIICHDQQCKPGQYIQTLGHDDLQHCASMTINVSQIIMCNFTHVNQWCVFLVLFFSKCATCWDCPPSHLPDKLTMMGFKLRSHGWKLKILTTLLSTHNLNINNVNKSVTPLFLSNRHWLFQRTFF